VQPFVVFFERKASSRLSTTFREGYLVCEDESQVFFESLLILVLVLSESTLNDLRLALLNFQHGFIDTLVDEEVSDVDLEGGCQIASKSRGRC